MGALFGTPKIPSIVQAAQTVQPESSQAAGQLQIPTADTTALQAAKTKKKKMEGTSTTPTNPAGLQIKV